MHAAFFSTILFPLVGVSCALNACYHAWSELDVGSCASASDCMDPEADCIFSVAANKHVCCKPKANAVFPVCPEGRQLLSVGKHSGVVCNGDDANSCPEGFQCMMSVTEFDKDPSQPNFVCCRT